MKEKSREAREQEYQKVAREVMAWLESEEGEEALARLRESGKWIELGSDTDLGYTDTYVLSGAGFFEQGFPTGQGAIHSVFEDMERKGEKSRTLPARFISARDAVMWADLCQDGISSPERFLSTLQEKLAAVASSGK